MVTRKRWYTCQVCGKEFWCYKCAANAPKSCGPVCQHKRNLTQLETLRKNPVVKESTCTVCGKVFVGRVKYRVYRACDDPECRAAIRHRAGRMSAETAEKKRTVERFCLRCDRKFKTDDRFTRICQDCKRVDRDSSISPGVYAEAWGGGTI